MRNHKYIAKVNTPSGIRYFYDQAEYAAYQNSKSGFNRPHSRTPKVAKTWYGATEQAKVFKGNKVHYNKDGKVRKSAFFGKKKPGTSVSGSTPEFITNSLAADGKKAEKARKARKEKQYESLNSVFEYQERMEREAAEADKKRVARKKRRAAKLAKIVNGVMRRN